MAGKINQKKRRRRRRWRQNQTLADKGKTPIVVEVVLNPVQVQVALRFVPVQIGKATVTVGIEPIIMPKVVWATAG